jgi:ABC-type Zn uptake system ZnuABC Zn-binding protein ZnuA
MYSGLAIAAVEGIATELSAIDLDGAEALRANAASYVSAIAG